LYNHKFIMNAEKFKKLMQKHMDEPKFVSNMKQFNAAIQECVNIDPVAKT